MANYPEFVEDTQFYHMDSDQEARDQQSAMLSNLKTIFQLSTQSYKSLDEVVHTFLNAGLSIFQLETGIVSHIENGKYEVIDVISNQDVINKGDEYPIEGTYCHQVYKCGHVLGFPHVGALGYMSDHPVYVNLKLESYLSAPIKVDGKLYGTLNFTSTQKRLSGFSEHERDLITLMASAIGNFLLLRDRENKLNISNQQLKKFVGFVAHDVRSPVGTIQSLAKMGLRKSTPHERYPKIFESISRLSTLTLDFVLSVLELSALGTGKIQPQLGPYQLSTLLNNAIASIADLLESKKSNIELNIDDQNIQIDSALMTQTITNLLMNAIKYSPEGSNIKVSSHLENNEVTLRITNDINDIAPNDESFESRYQSIGFGLEIASEIIAAHESQLHLEQRNNVFTASFALKLSA